MNNVRSVSWKEVVVGMVAGLFLVSAPATSQSSEPSGDPTVRMDNREPGSLNSGPGSVNSGSGENRGRRGGDDIRVAQAGDVRQEDRHEDRREDRRTDRREDRRSNTGGELRGLDRADHVAGEHGQQGRDNARAVQMERPNRPERVERPQRPERPEKPERGGRN